MEQVILKIASEHDLVTLNGEYIPFLIETENLIEELLDGNDHLLVSDDSLYGTDLVKLFRGSKDDSWRDIIVGDGRDELSIYTLGEYKIYLCNQGLLEYFTKIPEIIYVKTVKHESENSNN